MTEYSRKFKCRLCGEVYYNGKTREEEIVVNSIVESVFEQAGACIFDIHHCKDGGIGLSDLQGFTAKTVDRGEETEEE